MEKKPWHAPSLIVLVRGKSEEAVMDSCKGNETFGGPGPDANNPACYQEGTCVHCLLLQTS
jgi:hypothetical protein